MGLSYSYSNSEPGITASNNNVSIRFVTSPPLQLQIKQTMKSSLTQNEPALPSLFHLAARLNPGTAAIALHAQPSSIRTPFMDLMLNPKKLEMALLAAKKQNDAFAASRRYSDSGPAKLAIRNAPAKKTTKRDRANKPAPVSQWELVKVEFSLEAPLAKSVKLAADFTDWHKTALDMIKSEDGVWFTTVPLSPGSYSYRFIVDGKWHDDPNASARMPNPFGTTNAVVKVL